MGPVRILKFICPICKKKSDSSVVDTRLSVGNTIRRRRKCLTCGEKFTTQEFILETKMSKKFKFAIIKDTELKALRRLVSTVARRFPK